MKNLQEREDAMLHNPDAGVPIMQRYLRCPYNNNNCLQNGCAHYNPDTDECVHVEAAQAQVAIAKALLPVAAAESEQTGDIRQAAEWLEQGEFVRRKAWQTNDSSTPTRLALPIGGNHLCLQVGQGPRRDCIEWIPGTADLLATDWVVDRE